MRRPLCLAWLLWLAACDYYARPNRPLPADFKAHLLSGPRIDPGTLEGQAWVIALWVPG